MFCLRFFKAETRQRRRSRFESCVLFVLSYDDDARYIFTPISRATQFSDLNRTQILRQALSARGRMGTSSACKCGVLGLPFFDSIISFLPIPFQIPWEQSDRRGHDEISHGPYNDEYQPSLIFYTTTADWGHPWSGGPIYFFFLKLAKRPISWKNIKNTIVMRFLLFKTLKCF